jgi:uncharacterized cupredoxin-like copper-binding protein
VNAKRFLVFSLVIAAVVALTACAGGASNEPLKVTIKGEDIKYSLTSITAKVGQPIELTLDNVGALEHSFYLNEFGVKLEAQPGKKSTTTFTPDKAGTFKFYCHVAGHTEAGMAGELTVAP